MDYVLVYITAANLEEGRAIAQALVEKRVAACVNIISSIESLYWWQEKICQEEEVAIFAKTRKERVEDVISETKKIHSYSVPCIIALDITDGNPEFLDWISKEVR